MIEQLKARWAAGREGRARAWEKTKAAALFVHTHRTKFAGLLFSLGGAVQHILATYGHLLPPWAHGALLMLAGAITLSIGVYNTLKDFDP